MRFDFIMLNFSLGLVSHEDLHLRATSLATLHILQHFVRSFRLCVFLYLVRFLLIVAGVEANALHLALDRLHGNELAGNLGVLDQLKILAQVKGSDYGVRDAVTCKHLFEAAQAVTR